MVVWATAFTLSVQAQSLNIGLTGGVSFDKVSFQKENFNTQSEMGWFVGPKVQVGLIGGLGADVSALYNQRKISLKENGKSENFQSIEFPINVRYSIGLGSLASIYFATGPQFGLNIGSKEWKIKDFSHSYKTHAWSKSWNIGAGIRLMSHLEAGVTYNFALDNFANSKSSDDYDFKVNSLQAKICYYF